MLSEPWAIDHTAHFQYMDVSVPPPVCFRSSWMFKSRSQLLITFLIVLQVLKRSVLYVPGLHKPAEKLSSKLSYPLPCIRCLQRPLSVKGDWLSNYTSIPNPSLPYSFVTSPRCTYIKACALGKWAWEGKHVLRCKGIMTFPDQIIYSYLIKWNHITDIQVSRYYQHNWSISPSNNGHQSVLKFPSLLKRICMCNSIKDV